MILEKKCKGTGDAKGSGCGNMVPVAIGNEPNRIKGLGKSCGCYVKWLIGTPEGRASLKKAEITGKKKYENQQKKEVKTKKAKLREEKRDLNISGAMKLADTYFSRYIRLEHSIDGDCTCYTCGTVKPIMEVDNGHYIKREHKSTRYHENNCRPQCKTCNGDVKHNGKQAEFRVGLAYEIGGQAVIEIELLARQPIKASAGFYREIADIYREKVNELQKVLKVKYW